MKHILKVASAILLMSSLLGACRKDEKMNTTPATVNLQQEETPTGFRSMDPPLGASYNSNLRWDVAYLNIPEMRFEGDFIVAEANNREIKTHTIISNSENIQVDLLRPSLAGTLKVPSGAYEQVTITARSAPHAPINFTLYMSGNYPLDGRDVQVYVMMVVPASLSASWPGRVSLNNGEDYMSHVNISLDKLLTGFNDEYMRGLKVENGNITISAVRNFEAYNRIMNNLKGVLYIGF